MVSNWPPSGSSVRTLRELRTPSGRTVPANTRGTISQAPVRKFAEDRSDEFVIRILGEEVRVRRTDIAD